MRKRTYCISISTIFIYLGWVGEHILRSDPTESYSRIAEENILQCEIINSATAEGLQNVTTKAWILTISRFS